MNKALIVARHELTTMLSRTGFLVMTGLVPIAMLLLVGGLLISNYLNAISSYLIFWTGFAGI